LIGHDELTCQNPIDVSYSLQLESKIGSITLGKRVNFTVLEQNPLQAEPASIKSIELWGTVLEGRLQPISVPSVHSK
jgi:predicted amidohydrolase YtcJ